MTVFVDSAAFYALLDRDDKYHRPARTQWEEALSVQRRLVTSSWVFVESFALVQSRLGMDALRVLHDEILPAVEVIQVDSEVQAAAAQAVMAADRRRLSLVDCSSFQIMRQMEIRAVFTFDRHFVEQGFEVVPKERDQ